MGTPFRILFSTMTPSQNSKLALNKGTRWDRAAYKELRDTFYQLFVMYKKALEIPDATSWRRIYVIRRYSGRARRMDKGNFVGGCKSLLDAMTKAKLIFDDRQEFLEDHYLQVRSKVTEMEIVIWE